MYTSALLAILGFGIIHTTLNMFYKFFYYIYKIWQEWALTSEAWRVDVVKSLIIFATATTVCFLSMRACIQAMVWPTQDNHSILSTDTSLISFLLSFNLQKLQAIADLLVQLTELNLTLSLLTHAIGFLYLQPFAIPGTIFFNLSGGALYGLRLGFPLCLFYNATGSCCLYLVSYYLGGNLVDRFFKQRVEKMRLIIAEKQKGDKLSLFLYMISMRVFPFSPNWFLNVSSAQMKIPLPLFFFSVFLGLAPYNYLTCTAGLILKELSSTRDIMNIQTTIFLITAAVCFSLIPMLVSRSKTKNKLSSTHLEEEHNDQIKVSS